MVLAYLQKIPRGCHAARGLAPVLRLAQSGLILLLCGLPSLHSHGSTSASEQEIAAEGDLILHSEFATHKKRGCVFRGACRSKYARLFVTITRFPVYGSSCCPCKNMTGTLKSITSSTLVPLRGTIDKTLIKYHRYEEYIDHDPKKRD